MVNLLNEYETVTEAGYESNKDVKIGHIDSILVSSFRTLKDRTIKLGKFVTIIAGRNATMKTSLLGLIAHPFGSEAKDCFGVALKTNLANVFKLSDKHDGNYEYKINLVDAEGSKIFSSVYIYKRGGLLQKGFRVVVGKKHRTGEGNFNYNTSYMSFSRMNPIVETNAVAATGIVLSDAEKVQLKQFYERVLPSKHYSAFEAVKDKKIKETFGPAGNDVQYDFSSISSGEDNLGAIFNKLIAFQRASNAEPGAGNGIFCIDELEAGLHPSAQFALFKYFYEWAQRNKVQIVFTTHSIYLIERIYREYKETMDRDGIGINFISCAEAHDDKNYPILYNPEYSKAYKELTLETPEEVVASRKIKVLCEDKRAETFIKYLLEDEGIVSKLDIVTDRSENQPGTPWSALKQVLKVICKTFPVLLPDAFVVFDADVDAECLRRCDERKFTKLPDENGYPLEKRIAVFIIGLDNSDPMFRKFDKEQAAFLSDMSYNGIPISLTDIKLCDDIRPFKSWANNERYFDDIVKEYANRLTDEKNWFRNDVLEKMNFIYSSLGLPCISKPGSWEV